MGEKKRMWGPFEIVAVLAVTAYALHDLIKNNRPWWVWLALPPMFYYFIIYRPRQEQRKLDSERAE